MIKGEYIMKNIYLGFLSLIGTLLIVIPIIICLSILVAVWVIPIYLAFISTTWWLLLYLPIFIGWCVFVEYYSSKKEKDDEF